MSHTRKTERRLTKRTWNKDSKHLNRIVRANFNNCTDVSYVSWFIYRSGYVFTIFGIIADTVELHLSGLIGTANHPNMQKIRIIGVFFDIRLHWQFEVRLLLCTVCTLPAPKPFDTPDLKLYKP